MFRYTSYEETFSKDPSKGHEYHFVIPCRRCRSEHTITVKGPDLFRYHQGAFVQDAFPYLTAAQRELLISNTGDDCWQAIANETEEIYGE